MDKFLSEQRVPSVHDGNKSEPLMPLGKHWNGYGQVRSACLSLEDSGSTLQQLSKVVRISAQAPIVACF